MCFGRRREKKKKSFFSCFLVFDIKFDEKLANFFFDSKTFRASFKTFEKYKFFFVSRNFFSSIVLCVLFCWSVRFVLRVRDLQIACKAFFCFALYFWGASLFCVFEFWNWIQFKKQLNWIELRRAICLQKSCIEKKFAATFLKQQNKWFDRSKESLFFVFFFCVLFEEKIKFKLKSNWRDEKKKKTLCLCGLFFAFGAK